MVTIRTTAAFAATIAVAALVAPAAAQAPAATGSVRGVVTDKEFGAPIAGAAVTVLGTRARVSTADNGSYIVPNLPEGTYTLVITKDGFVREVRPNVRVGGGSLVDADIGMAGEFEARVEFVVQDMVLGGEPLERQELVVPDTFEPILVIPPIDFQLRLEAPQLLNVLNVEMITRSGASDAAAALLMVPGASLQDGKYAVIRGLPDRYVATLLDGVRLPSADPDVRAVKLDQFPAAIIKSIQVSKNFTPDQQGDASGGAVNVELRDMPDEGYLRISSQIGFNSQVQNGQFLTYKGAGMDFWGNNNVLAQQRDLAGQSWPNNPTGTEFGDAPMIYKWNVAAGDSWEVDDGVKVGAFGNFFYEQDASAYDNGQLNTLMQVGSGSQLSPRP
ncbi:MAG: carboxypeptidase regulatory-like domain-containing protein, partial [Phycisphaerales bacterium]